MIVSNGCGHLQVQDYTPLGQDSLSVHVEYPTTAIPLYVGDGWPVLHRKTFLFALQKSGP